MFAFIKFFFLLSDLSSWIFILFVFCQSAVMDLQVGGFLSHGCTVTCFFFSYILILGA